MADSVGSSVFCFTDKVFLYLVCSPVTCCQLLPSNLRLLFTETGRPHILDSLLLKKKKQTFFFFPSAVFVFAFFCISL